MEIVHILKVTSLKQTEMSNFLSFFFFLNLRLKLYFFNVKKKMINSPPSIGLFVEYLWFSKKHKYKLIIT